MGVFLSRPRICPFLPFRKNTRFIWYYCFVKKQTDHTDMDVEEIPKLVFAGSSPVARSMNFPTLPSGGVFF